MIPGTGFRESVSFSFVKDIQEFVECFRDLLFQGFLLLFCIVFEVKFYCRGSFCVNPSFIGLFYFLYVSKEDVFVVSGVQSMIQPFILVRFSQWSDFERFVLLLLEPMFLHGRVDGRSHGTV